MKNGSMTGGVDLDFVLIEVNKLFDEISEINVY